VPAARPVAVVVVPGGVGRNIAENLARLGTQVHLVSAVGADALGDELLAATAAARVDVGNVRRGPQRHRRQPAHRAARSHRPAGRGDPRMTLLPPPVSDRP
jgi:sugar/nucleoside kinase (ribokinase family)